MKSIIIVALAVVAIAVAAPAEPEPPKILHSEYVQQPQGSYLFNFETENGINRQENGELKQALDEENKPRDVVVVRGSYSYINADGQSENVNYYADENGYHAEGPSIPKGQ